MSVFDWTSCSVFYSLSETHKKISQKKKNKDVANQILVPVYCWSKAGLRTGHSITVVP